MQLKELIIVLGNNTYINIVSEKGQQLYEGKVMFNTSNLLMIYLKEKLN